MYEKVWDLLEVSRFPMRRFERSGLCAGDRVSMRRLCTSVGSLMIIVVGVLLSSLFLGSLLKTTGAILFTQSTSSISLQTTPLSSMPSTPPPAESPESPSLLFQWLSAHNGSYHKIRVSGEGQSRGVFATESIAEGEIVLSVPSSLSITPTNVLQCPQSICRVLRRVQNHTKLHSISEKSNIVVFLLWHVSLGSSSPWYPWISCLPGVNHPSSFKLPYSFSDDDLALLKGFEAGNTALSYRKRVRRLYDAWKSLVFDQYSMFQSEFFTFERFSWAFSLRLSRTFASGFIPGADMFNHHSDIGTPIIKSLSAPAIRKLLTEISHSPHSPLSNDPFLKNVNLPDAELVGLVSDILLKAEHSPSDVPPVFRSLNLSRVKADDFVFIVRSRVALQKGEEVFLHYFGSDYPLSKQFNNYGFFSPSSSSQDVILKWKETLNHTDSERKVMLEEFCQRWAIPHSPHIDIILTSKGVTLESLVILRVLSASSSEKMHLRRALLGLPIGPISEALLLSHIVKQLKKVWDQRSRMDGVAASTSISKSIATDSVILQRLRRRLQHSKSNALYRQAEIIDQRLREERAIYSELQDSMDKLTWLRHEHRLSQ